MRPAHATPTPAAQPAPERPVARAKSRYHLSSRHSRVVTLLKFLLPLAAGVLVLLLVAWPRIQPSSLRPERALADLSLSDATSGRMANPRFTGIDSHGNPFLISAASAQRAPSTASDLIDLETPQADVVAEDGTWLAISAATGRYREGARILALNGDVNLFHDKGYEIYTEQAEINIATGVATGSQPVRGHGPLGELAGEGFRLERESQRLFLTGRARLVIFPGAGGAAP